MQQHLSGYKFPCVTYHFPNRLMLLRLARSSRVGGGVSNLVGDDLYVRVCVGLRSGTRRTGGSTNTHTQTGKEAHINAHRCRLNLQRDCGDLNLWLQDENKEE